MLLKELDDPELNEEVEDVGLAVVKSVLCSAVVVSAAAVVVSTAAVESAAVPPAELCATARGRSGPARSRTARETAGTPRGEARLTMVAQDSLLTARTHLGQTI